jgi:ADP-ribose pyrophosphatase YjhB (NUDIX family)
VTLKLRHRLLQSALLAYGRVSRGMTLGVRAMLLEDGRVMLVKHGYLPGWYLPGGGVEAGETLGESLAREIEEEAGATLTAPPLLFGVYRNAKASPRDHVALFVCRAWTAAPTPHIPNREILEAALFPIDALPDDVTPATLARLREVIEGIAPAPDW